MPVPYTAIAKYAYDPDPENASDDLPLTPDQIITVTEVVDNDWLFGSSDDGSGNVKSGYFPAAFTEPYTVEEPEAVPSPVKADSVSVPEPQSQIEESTIQEKEEEEIPGSPILESAQKSLDPKLKTIESNIVHEPENFKNKLQSFNVSSSPIIPMEKPKEESFVKKAFTVSDHHTSYIPPSLGSNKPVKKEEKKPDVVAGDIISESTKVEEIEAPRMTLKERMKLLQQQQEEERKALEAALKRKEERKKAKQHHPAQTEAEAETQAGNPEAAASPVENIVASESDSDEPNVAGDVMSGTTKLEQTKTVENKEIDEYKADEEEEGVANDNNNEDGDDINDDDDDDDEEEEEEDEEELRKRKLAERMAKLSGGMGMMGMMGMMGAPLASNASKKTKKPKKEKKVEEEDNEELNDLPKAIPILPMGSPGAPLVMGMPMPTSFGNSQSQVDDGEASDSGDEKEEVSQVSTAPVEAEAEDQNDVLEPPEETTDISSSFKAPAVPPVPTTTAESDSTEDENENENEDSFHDTVEAIPSIPEPMTIPTPTTTEQHPYRQQFATPTATVTPTVPSSTVVPPIPSASVPPAIPTSSIKRASTTAPPMPPITAPPTRASTTSEYSKPIMVAPPIPGMPPSMPQTSAPTSPSAPPPAPPTATAPNPPTFTTSAPPPIPGAAPSVPVTTQSATSTHPPPVPRSIPGGNISRHSSIKSPPPPIPESAPTIPALPTSGAPPIPGVATRHSTLGNVHAHPPPPPPPPTDAVPSIPETSGSGIQRQTTRSSLETKNSISDAAPINVAQSSLNSEYWWTTKSLPPQLTKTDTYFEVESTDIHKRGGKLIKYLIYYVLDAHLTSITMELAYDTSEPERLLFFHEEKEKNKGNRNKLIDEYTKYGPLAYNTAVKTLNKTYDGEYIDFIFSNLPKEVLRPIANKTFGGVVYRNNNGDVKLYDEIRPGDVLVLVNSIFDSHSGEKKVGFDKPHVALVTSYDVEKDKIKVVEQVDGTVQQGRYKLKNMKSGKLRVFRIVGRDYVGW